MNISEFEKIVNTLYGKVITICSKRANSAENMRAFADIAPFSHKCANAWLGGHAGPLPQGRSRKAAPAAFPRP
jgi:hypothetical protein